MYTIIHQGENYIKLIIFELFKHSTVGTLKKVFERFNLFGWQFVNYDVIVCAASCDFPEVLAFVGIVVELD